MSNSYLDTIIEKAKSEGKKIKIYAHRGLDGDAYGSGKSLELFLSQNGVDATFVTNNQKISYNFSKICGPLKEDKVEDEEYIAVVLDYSTFSNADSVEYKSQNPENIYLMDHHKVDKDTKSIEEELNIPQKNVIRNTKAAATSEILAEEIIKSGKMTRDLATSLLLGIFTDTATFRHFEPRTLEVVRDLIESGTDYNKVYQIINQKKSMISQVSMAREMINQDDLSSKIVRIDLNGKSNANINVLMLDYDAVKRLEEARTDRIERKVFVLADMGNTAINSFVVEKEPNHYFVELRSFKDVLDIDVGSIASRNGGGGLHNASGFDNESEETIEEYSRKLFLGISSEIKDKVDSYEEPKDTDNDRRLKFLLEKIKYFSDPRRMDRKSLIEIEKLYSAGTKYSTIYEDKISYEEFMTRQAILSRISDEDVKKLSDRDNREPYIMNLDQKFVDDIKRNYGLDESQILDQIKMFKDIRFSGAYLSIILPNNRGKKIDHFGNIRDVDVKPQIINESPDKL